MFLEMLKLRFMTALLRTMLDDWGPSFKSWPNVVVEHRVMNELEDR
jgi:hypothetical protein